MRAFHVIGAMILAGLVVCAMPATAFATRIGDLCDVQGAQSNSLKGVGLVVGLAGTGDRARAAIVAQQHLMEHMNVDVTDFSDLSSHNTAVVMVTAELPAFAKPGTRIDVVVSSLYDAKSLEGGTLLETILFGLDNQPYVVAQGPVSVGGFNSSSNGSSIQQNFVTVGRVPAGGSVERDVPATITDGERINLLLRRPDFTTATHIEQAINKIIGPGTASAFGAGMVNVKIPAANASELVPFIARVQDIQVESGYPAKVVINERTGTIVVGGDAVIKPCQVAHGNLSITITATKQVSQPPAFSQGKTTPVTNSNISAQEEQAYLMPVQGTSASEVATALNKLKVTPRDMIAIFQALREAGALQAELDIM